MAIGVDIVDLNRISIDKEHFVLKILTPNEYEVFQSLNNDQRKREYLGGRFAGKEAYMKAYGVGIGDLSFQSIEILNHDDGRPYLNDANAQISISHEKEIAIAFVMILK